jgi:hypothetical protein
MDNDHIIPVLQQLLKNEFTFVLSSPCNGKRICRHRSLDLGIVEVYNSSVILYHVHFLNARYVCDRQLFQVALKLFIVGSGRLVDNLLLSSGSALNHRFLE